MRHAIVFALLAALGAEAGAQEREPPRPFGARARRIRERMRDPAEASRICASRQNVLANEQKRVESYKAELVGLDSEVAQLQRRIEDLRRQREEARRNLAYTETRYKEMESDWTRDCKASEDCSLYDARAQELERHTGDVEARLGVVRDEIRGNRDAIGRLEASISPLQREYDEKRCNALVAGETEQGVIDRCTVLFSEWNRLQAELNRQNARVPDLRSRYEQLLSELKGLEQRASGYEAYLSRNCSASPQIATMRGYGERRVRARGIGEDLDRLVGDIARLRKLKISVRAQ